MLNLDQPAPGAGPQSVAAILISYLGCCRAQVSGGMPDMIIIFLWE